jgi:hypothetical protein
MATKHTKKTKNTKSLKKAKKLEATKPLVSLNYSKIKVSY